MAWEQRLLDAKFRGVTFDCQLWDDDWERHAVEHTRPFVDGAEMEDLGRGARRMRIKAIFFGDDYEDRLEAFLKVLDEPGPGDLVHPVFGPLKAQVATPHVHHEAENVDQAEVEVTFAESALGAALFTSSKPGQKAAAVATKSSSVREAAASALAKAVAVCKNITAMSRAGLRVIAELKAMVDTVTTSGAGITSIPRAWASDVASLIASVVDLKSFSSSSLVSDWKSTVAILNSAILSLTSNNSSATSSASSGSGGSSDATLALTPGDELDKVRAHVELERALGIAEATQAVLESEADTPTLTPDEIEAVTATTRERLQASSDTYRALYGLEEHRPVTEGLKDVAAAILAAAEAILEAKPPLVDHTLAARTCPRLLAHQLYGDHTRAAEILRLNALADPNFLTPGEVLRVYAS
jgi:prophage DNA circulation protein